MNPNLHFFCRIAQIVGPVAALSASAALAVDITRPLSDVAGLTPSTLTAAYLDDVDAITSAPLFGAAHSAIEVAVTQNNNVMQRIAALRSGARGVELSGFNLQTDGQHIGGDLMNAAWRPTLGKVLDGVLRSATAMTVSVCL